MISIFLNAIDIIVLVTKEKGKFHQNNPVIINFLYLNAKIMQSHAYFTVFFMILKSIW